MTRVFVPIDAGALSVGAELVARAIATEAARRGVTVELIRTGSRGLYWLEPLVEVATSTGRIGYGPVAADAVPSLFDAGFLTGAPHATRIGQPEGLDYLARQERLTFSRVGLIDPRSIADYRATGGFRGLERALEMDPGAIVETVVESGLRGRGGAAFPTGIKWRTVLGTTSDRKFVVCNADEGDSGTFADRMLMEGDPLVLIEGMTIAGLAVGARHGVIYLRSEYPHAARTLRAAIAAAREAGYLGASVAGSGRAFDVEIRMGAGAYICGEETAMLESIEGRRGQVRFKPPLPAVAGLFGQPTVVNNVLSLATVPIILERGAAFHRDYGMGRSRGTLAIQLAGNIRRGGLIEKAFGLTVREVLEEFGGGSLSGRPIRTVQIGGPLGAYLPESQFDLPLDYEAFAAVGAMVGHGGIVAFDESVDMAAMARWAMEFCAIESCGKCTPCRIGSVRGVEVIDRMVAARARGDDDGVEAQARLLRDLCETMVSGSLCALGGMAPYPVRSALDHFPEDFGLPAATTSRAG